MNKRSNECTVCIPGSRWGVHISYKITRYPYELTQDVTDREIARAFQLWADVTNLSFKQTWYTDADIEIRYLYDTIAQKSYNTGLIFLFIILS